MRLSEFEIKSIMSSFNTHFNSGNIYLFGSRVDDTQKGGDIDLYIDTEDVDCLLGKKLEMISDIKAKIG